MNSSTSKMKKEPTIIIHVAELMKTMKKKQPRNKNQIIQFSIAFVVKLKVIKWYNAIMKTVNINGSIMPVWVLMILILFLKNGIALSVEKLLNQHKISYLRSYFFLVYVY